MSDDDQVRRLERLLMDVSSRLAGLSGEEMDVAIREAVRDLALFLGVQRSALLEFAADGAAFETVHFWAADGVHPVGRVEISSLPWYTARLRAGEPVILESIPEDLPLDAHAERSYGAAMGLKASASVPIPVVGRPVCALTAGDFRSRRSWPPSLVERMRLYGQVLTAAVHRRRQEQALEESHAEIERLNRRLRRENRYLKEEARGERHADEIVGRSPGLQRALMAAEKVGPTDTTVLVLGETGTGKELLARAIHEHSPRAEQPLVKLNCAALPSGLVESELFGHEKGAFTGAAAARPGRFEVADGGTLFLDEVGDLPAEAQAKVLRVLQEGEFERLGSTRTRRVNVRLVAATNRDLESEAKAGHFRVDLYYRLSVFPITIPPLRERPEDIEPLVWFFVHRRQKALGRRVEAITPAAIEAFKAYDWPGNVRELESVVERAMILSTGKRLQFDDAFPVRAPAALPAGRRWALDSVQRAHIESVLAECGWKINGPGNAADRLALQPSTLRSRMKKLGIQRPGA